MPTIPDKLVLTATSADVLNAIKNSATQNYKNYVPYATPDAESVKSIGAVIMQDVGLQNEFLNGLVNRIGRVYTTSKTYQNPWASFKKGIMDMGETIEEIFVNLAKPSAYNPDDAETSLFKQYKPDVRTAFHVLNYQKLYPVTIRQEQLKQAFLSWSGVTDLITKIINSIYTASNYDEFLTMKYLLAKHILNGHIYPVSIPPITTDNMNDIVSVIKGTSNDMEFMKTTYNLAGVSTFCMKEDQYLLTDSHFDAKMDVEVLAKAFNMEKSQFLGHQVLVDSFGSLDNDRLALLFADDPEYTPLTPAQLTALNSIPAVLVDKDWFMIFDNLIQMNEQPNSKGLYWNYFYHIWKIFSVSPFANNAIFIPGTPSVDSITVSPSTATIAKGNKILLTATVATSNFAPQSVNWSINSELSTIDNSGNLTVGTAETATTITVTATSTYTNADASVKTGTATITVA